MNRKHILSDSRCHHETRLVELEDSCYCNGSSSIPRLLKTVLHEMLGTPAFIAGVVQFIVLSITMVSTTMLACLRKLRKISRRWRSGSNHRRGHSGSLVNTILGILFLLILVLDSDITNVLVTNSKKFFN